MWINSLGIEFYVTDLYDDVRDGIVILQVSLSPRLLSHLFHMLSLHLTPTLLFHLFLTLLPPLREPTLRRAGHHTTWPDRIPYDALDAAPLYTFSNSVSRPWTTSHI